MGFSKDEKSKRIIRVIKTIFFLITMFISFLFFSAPVLLALADSLLPSALLSLSFLSPQSLSSLLINYDFKSSLVDIPLLSILRSLLILCVYSCCDGPRLSRGPYLSVATACTVVSLVFVSLKAAFVFGAHSSGGGGGYGRAVEVALFASSYVLAVGHVVVAYRTSCRERKKLLVYKIDIEAVSACKKGFPRYEKLVQHERMK